MKELVVEKENLKHNLKIINEIISKDKKKAKLIAVVKGNGYGLDLVKYTQFLIDNGVDFFAVATVEEAVALRNAGITQNILMMSSTAVKEDIEILIKNNIILTVGSKEAGEAVEEIAQKLQTKARAHLKIDTGFGRYGFIYSNKEKMVQAIKAWKNIKIEGAFSHFSIAFFGDGNVQNRQPRKISLSGALKRKEVSTLAYVPVPKDLTKVKTKVMFNLTKRQLICFTGGALIGVPLFFLLRKPTGNSVAAMCMMLVMLPFFMLAMYEKHGQPLEKIVGNILKVAVIRPKQRPYQTNNFYAVLKRQEMLDKEVYDIVHRNKKMAASDVRKNRGKNCAAGKDKEKTVPRR